MNMDIEKIRRNAPPTCHFNDGADDLRDALEDALCALEEAEESGDLEERLEAIQNVEDAEARLRRHMLNTSEGDHSQN
jgi:hypothetical protein